MHILEGCIQEGGVADFTGPSASGGTAVIINAALDVCCGKHNLAVSAVEHLRIRAVDIAVFGPINDVLVSFAPCSNVFLLDALAGPVAFADRLL